MDSTGVWTALQALTSCLRNHFTLPTQGLSLPPHLLCSPPVQLPSVSLVLALGEAGRGLRWMLGRVERERGGGTTGSSSSNNSKESGNRKQQSWDLVGCGAVRVRWGLDGHACMHALEAMPRARTLHGSRK